MTTTTLMMTLHTVTLALFNQEATHKQSTAEMVGKCQCVPTNHNPTQFSHVLQRYYYFAIGSSEGRNMRCVGVLTAYWLDY